MGEKVLAVDHLMGRGVEIPLPPTLAMDRCSCDWRKVLREKESPPRRWKQDAAWPHDPESEANLAVP
ncbi:MAG: hypothetical protein ACUVS1_03655 [Actinomycetota bacterium]